MRPIAVVAFLAVAALAWLSPARAAAKCGVRLPALSQRLADGKVPPNPTFYFFLPDSYGPPPTVAAHLVARPVPVTITRVSSVPAFDTYRIDVRATVGTLELSVFRGERFVQGGDYEIDERWTPGAIDLAGVEHVYRPSSCASVDAWYFETSGDQVAALELRWGTTRSEALQNPNSIVLPVDTRVFDWDVPRDGPWSVGLGKTGCNGLTFPAHQLPDRLWVSLAARQADGSVGPATQPFRLGETWSGPVPVPLPPEGQDAGPASSADPPHDTWSVAMLAVAAAALAGLGCGLFLSLATHGPRRRRPRPDAREPGSPR